MAKKIRDQADLFYKSTASSAHLIARICPEKGVEFFKRSLFQESLTKRVEPKLERSFHTN